MGFGGSGGSGGTEVADGAKNGRGVATIGKGIGGGNDTDGGAVGSTTGGTTGGGAVGGTNGGAGGGFGLAMKIPKATPNAVGPAGCTEGLKPTGAASIAAAAANIDEGILTDVPSVTAFSTISVQTVVNPSLPSAYPEETARRLAAPITITRVRNMDSFI